MTVSAVVIAMIGKALISGVPMTRACVSRPLPEGMPELARMTAGTVTARISGGCTIGLNRLCLRTAAIAATAPTR